MNDVKAVVRDILVAFDNLKYPSEFLAKYNQVGCFASSHGTETFLIKSKDTNQLFVAKCYDKKLYSFVHEGSILRSLNYTGLPAFADEFQNDDMFCIVREYIEGKPLSQYIIENNPTNDNIINICIKICDILAYIHGQEKPVIHRDIKPQNIIIKDDGQIVLIDFDISRVYNNEVDSDTHLFGTREYASPEQYGFSQTDCRTDIYSFGVLLRFMLTKDEKEKQNSHIYKPLERIIKKCTAFSPKDRFDNALLIKKALINANSESRKTKKIIIIFCLISAIVLCAFGIIRWNQYATNVPYAGRNEPIVISNEEIVADAVSYMDDKYNTDLFDDAEAYADIGFVKTVLTDVYGYDNEYVHAMPSDGAPHESEDNFLPWGMGNEQYVPRDVMVYVAVKIYWIDKISDYSSLKDDNGYYPGVRVAIDFAEKTGILNGVTRPEDITKGEVAVLLSNADRLYEATKK